MAQEGDYFLTVRDQLINGLQLERDRVVLGAISDAGHAVIGVNADDALKGFGYVNRKLQERLTVSLTVFLAHDGARDVSQIP